jgi:hypothetical protein
MGHRTRATTAIDALAVVLVTGALGLLALRLGRSVQSQSDGVVALLMLVAGYLVADALTGFVHWFCDTFFEETTPVLGRGLIAPFRERRFGSTIATRY